MEDWQNGGFGLYVHWPFCVSKCPYCDFNSHVAGTVDQAEWADAYQRAIAAYAQELPGCRLRSIYFGGGTPSLMSPDLVERVLSAAQAGWHFANDIEITLEANPNSVEAARFQQYRQAGVNRVSLGIQALNDYDLRRLGRMHSAAEALAALDVARQVFDRVSFDLIYARQDQSLSDWQAELEFALSLAPDHLSLYQLSVEPGTVFGARARAGKLPGLPDEDQAADMYELTNLMCHTNGLPAYEVSNHARDGMLSQHNMIYWQAGDYVGVGPGAHGRLSLASGRFASETPLAPGDWLACVAEGGKGEALRSRLSAGEQATEYLLMGMRTYRGVSLARLQAIGGRLPDAATIADLQDLGMIETSQQWLRPTPAGMAVLNAVIGALVSSLPEQ